MSARTHGLVTLLMLLMSGGPAQRNDTTPFRWPAVRPVEKHYSFSVASRAKVNLLIEDTQGDALYLLGCLPELPEGDKSAAGLSCYLVPIAAPDLGLESPTLLNDDPMEARIPHGRGEFWVDNLRGDCAAYPEYGSERTFRLRGMKIVLRVTNVVFGPTRTFQTPARTLSTMLSFGLQISVSPDPSTLSAISQPVPIGPPRWKEPLDPWNAHPDCRVVIPAHVPGILNDGLLDKAVLSGPYPRIARQEKTLILDAEQEQGYKFAPVGSPMPPPARMVTWSLVDDEGRRAYDFACSGDEAAGGFDRLGIVCGLFVPGSDFNLLTENVDPYSRTSPAQILPQQLSGECGDYPQWGLERTFRLRSMRLTLHFSNPVFTEGDFESPALASVQLKLSVVPDPSASSSVAAPPSVIDWGFLGGPPSCRRIIVPPS